MQANYANALCHRNATPLSVAVLAPCAWGENLVARQIRLGKCGEIGGVCECLGGGLLFLFLFLSLSLSLSLSLLALFGTLKFLNALFLGFCALFVILNLCKKATQRVARRKPQQKNPHKLKENLPFLDTSLALSMTNSGFCLKTTDKENALCHLATIDKSHNFAHQKHFFTQILGTKFTNFIRFYGLPRSLCSLAMTADFVILSLLQKGEKSKGLKAHLLFLDTSLTLSMTNSGFCLKITDIFTQILKQKFKFFTQNSRHFVNSTHFINLSQILSPTQGFFIFLPQIFEQFLLINLVERRSYGSSWHKRQDKNSRAD